MPGGAELVKQADEAVAKFDLKDPAASVPALLAIRKRLSSIAVAATDPVVTEKRRQLDRAIQGCLGLVVETTVPRAEVVPGEVLTLRHVATVGGNVPVRWLAVRYPLTGQSVDGPHRPARRPSGHARREASAARRHAADPAILAARRALGRHVQGRARHADRPPREPAGVSGRARVPGGRPDAGDRRRARAGGRQGRAGPAARRDRAGGAAVPVGRPALRAGFRAAGGGRGRRPRAIMSTGTLDLDVPDGWKSRPGHAAVPAGGRRRRARS